MKRTIAYTDTFIAYACSLLAYVADYCLVSISLKSYIRSKTVFKFKKVTYIWNVVSLPFFYFFSSFQFKDVMFECRHVGDICFASLSLELISQGKIFSGTAAVHDGDAR